MGRPSTYTPALADAICARLAEGEPLRVICRDEGMPAWRTVYGWMAGDEELSARIAHARKLGFDAIAEECVDIADGKGDPQRDKLRIDTRLKLLAKWDPKRFGDSVSLKHSDPEGGPLKVAISVNFRDPEG